MFGKPFKIFTVSGVPVQADVSVVLIALLIAGGMESVFFDAHVVVRSPMIWGVVAAILFLGSILWHEGAHALIARREHVHVRSVTLYMFGGATQADLDSSKPREEFLVAVGGPASTLLLALSFGAVAWILGVSSPTGVMFAELARINRWIALFNIIPAFPLDGGRVLRAGVAWLTKSPPLGNLVAKWVGTVAGASFIGYALWLFAHEQPIYAVFMGYIGFVVVVSSQQLVRQEGTRAALRGMTVGQAAKPRPVALEGGTQLLDALDQLRTYPEATFPVIDEQGRLIGMITLERATAVGQGDPLVTVAGAMNPIDGTKVIASDASLLTAVERMGETPWLLVLSDQMLTGIIAMDDVERAFQATRGRAT